ncbi:glycosyltransferase family 4 protein [Actinomycetospora sp. NBRC 106378]|uniref:glycosyltransferase family 4 protein n=1 Tax=Actinomycetospora sp. NBRC 106378 TaxID=3032208 RepID=UPI0024A28F74|nr:glycosyltransferase family 4 protein [Actinomycetospora sp. NBRC 106378]GLZ55629.1 glycosyl transferase [Actinomycetospora sp. NBRC 106378]
MTRWTGTAWTGTRIDTAPRRSTGAARRRPGAEAHGPADPRRGTDPLRVAVVAPPWLELPPDAYGGVEAMCSDLVDALVRRGVAVTLLAPGEHGTTAAFRPTGPVADPRLMGQALPEVVHAAQLPELLADLGVDVVHDNTLAGPLVAASHGLPTVVTAHGPVQGALGTYYRALSVGAALVALSDAQRGDLPTARWAATVPNGVRPDRFPFRAEKDEYALFLGRMSPDKGPVAAIDAARAAGIPLVMAAKCREDAEVAYFEHAVEPLLGGDVEWVGEVGGRRKLDLLAGARCLLFPIDWEEPFGMVMIEAMACGTPVVALRRGAVPEVVDHGRTGWVCDRPVELPGAMLRAHEIDPRECRAVVEGRFSDAKLAANYERVYRRTAAVAREAARPAS